MTTSRNSRRSTTSATPSHHRLTGNRPVQFITAPVPFTRHQAPSLGLTLYRLKTDPRYCKLYHGAWVDTQPETEVIAPLWADHEWALKQMHLRALLRLYDDVAACNVTAARLYGLPLPPRMDEGRMHVATSALNASKSRRGVVLHRYGGLRVSSFFELPLISVPQLFIELAPIMTVDQLTAIGDAAIGRWTGGPLTSLSALRGEVAARDRIRDRRTAEQALDLIREDVDSPRETWLRLWLIRHGFPEPVIHPEIDCPVIPAVLHPDLGCPESKVAIEYEGDHHRRSDDQFAADNQRLEAMTAEGWTVLRVSKSTNMRQFGRLLRSHLASE